MVNLDWNIGQVNEGNDSLIWGALWDVATLTNRTAWSIANTLSPSALAVVDNSATLVRKPIKTVFTAENYGKLAKTVPAIPMDLAMKGVRLPIWFIDNVLNYGINNNLERWVAGIKALTTWFLANIVTNNGNTRFKALKALGAFIEWTGDVVGTVVKIPTWALAAGTSIVDRFMAKGTTFTENFVNSVRVSGDNFIGVKPFTNSADTPQAANDERAAAA